MKPSWTPIADPAGAGDRRTKSATPGNAPVIAVSAGSPATELRLMLKAISARAAFSIISRCVRDPMSAHSSTLNKASCSRRGKSASRSRRASAAAIAATTPDALSIAEHAGSWPS